MSEGAGESDPGTFLGGGLSLVQGGSVDLNILGISDTANLSMLASPSSPPALDFSIGKGCGWSSAIASGPFFKLKCISSNA